MSQQTLEDKRKKLEIGQVSIKNNIINYEILKLISCFNGTSLNFHFQLYLLFVVNCG